MENIENAVALSAWARAVDERIRSRTRVANCDKDFFELFQSVFLPPVLSSIRRRRKWLFPTAILVTASRNIWLPSSP
jgi:hypothetical protein